MVDYNRPAAEYPWVSGPGATTGSLVQGPPSGVMRQPRYVAVRPCSVFVLPEYFTNNSGAWSTASGDSVTDRALLLGSPIKPLAWSLFNVSQSNPFHGRAANLKISQKA